MEHFQMTARDMAVAEATKIVATLVANDFRVYCCDPGDDTSNQFLWEERRIFVCKVAGEWMDTCWVQRPTGEFSRIIVRNNALYVSPDKCNSGEFFLFYETPFEW